MVADGEKPDAPMTAEQMASPRYVLREIAEAIRDLKQTIKTTKKEQNAAAYKRLFDVLEKGHALAKKVGAGVRDTMERLADDGFLAQQDKDLDACQRAITTARGLPPQKKRALIERIDRTRGLKRQARADKFAGWAYIGQDDETGQFFTFAPVHRRIWAALQSDSRGVLVEVHPGVGKSVLLRGYMLMEIVEDPTLRFLLVFGTKEKAVETIAVLRKYIQSSRFRALYPNIRILGRAEGTASDKYCFSVNRPNWNARDATVRAAAPNTPMQGASADRLIFDDICHEDVVYQDGLRKTINFKFFNVFMKRLRKRARSKARGVGTPWHPEDVLGKIEHRVKEGLWPDWEVCKLPVRDDPETGLALAELWADEFTTEVYEAEKADPETNYPLLYRLDAEAGSPQGVERVWFYPSDPSNPAWRTYTEEQRQRFAHRLEEIEQRGEHWLSIDPSGTGHKHSSKTAVTHIILSPQGPAYVKDCWLRPGDSVGLLEFVLEKIAGPMLFAERYVRPEEDDRLREQKERAAAKARAKGDGGTPAAGGIDRVLIEEQGSQKAGADLFGRDVREELRRMGVRWGGFVKGFVCSGPKGGQNLAKVKRLAWVAPKIRSSAIQVRGRVFWSAPDRRRSKRPATDELAELVTQIKRPTGLLDALDTVTQFLIENFDRVHLSASGVAETPPPETEFERSMRRSIEELCRQADDEREGRDEREREDEWLSTLSAA